MTACQLPIALLVSIWVTPITAAGDQVPLDIITHSLPAGWTTKSDGASITIIRQRPIWIYNPLSMPFNQEAEIERRKHPHAVIFKLTFKPAISMEDLWKLEKANANTDKAIAEIKKRMQSFWGKGSYVPKTLQDQAIYDEFKNKLKTLPYHVLPDGWYNDSMVYIEGNLPGGYSMFYDTREKYDCLSVLTRIFTIVTPVDPHHLRFQFKEDQLSDILWGKRGWERHIRRKERDE